MKGRISSSADDRSLIPKIERGEVAVIIESENPKESECVSEDNLFCRQGSVAFDAKAWDTLKMPQVACHE